MSTYPQTEVNDHPANWGVTCGQLVDYAAFDGFLDRNYCYKSVAIQIIHSAMLASILYTGREFEKAFWYLSE